MKKSLIVFSPEETMQLGNKLSNFLQPKDVILLDGDLGAGKTTFTKGLAKGLGIKRPVRSPTFTIIREYPQGRIPLYHMDIYRLEDGSADELGLDEYFNGDGVSVVEWSKFVADALPKVYLRIIFQRDDKKGENFRNITFESDDARFSKIIEQILGEKK